MRVRELAKDAVAQITQPKRAGPNTKQVHSQGAVRVIPCMHIGAGQANRPPKLAPPPGIMAPQGFAECIADKTRAVGDSGRRARALEGALGKIGEPVPEVLPIVRIQMGGVGKPVPSCIRHRLEATPDGFGPGRFARAGSKNMRGVGLDGSIRVPGFCRWLTAGAEASSHPGQSPSRPTHPPASTECPRDGGFAHRRRLYLMALPMTNSAEVFREGQLSRGQPTPDRRGEWDVDRVRRRFADRGKITGAREPAVDLAVIPSKAPHSARPYIFMM